MINKLKAIGGLVKCYAPEILMVTGGVAIVGGTIAACVQTHKKFGTIKENAHERFNSINDIEANGEKAKQFVKATASTVWDFTKTYAIPGGLIIGGLGCLGCSAGILKKRTLVAQASAAAAWGMVNKVKDAITDEYGPEKWEDIMTGSRKVKAVVRDVDEETGEVVETEEEIRLSSDEVKDLWTVLFDETTCPGYWSKSPGLNPMRIKQTQCELNKRLQTSGGHLYVRDAMISLGFENPVIIYEDPVTHERTDLASTYGWVWIPGVREDEIDFGVFRMRGDDPTWQQKGLFIEGKELSTWITFNPSGDITKLVPMLLYRKALNDDYEMTPPWEEHVQDPTINDEIDNELKTLKEIDD